MAQRKGQQKQIDSTPLLPSTTTNASILPVLTINAGIFTKSFSSFISRRPPALQAQKISVELLLVLQRSTISFSEIVFTFDLTAARLKLFQNRLQDNVFQFSFFLTHYFSILSFSLCFVWVFFSKSFKLLLKENLMQKHSVYAGEN